MLLALEKRRKKARAAAFLFILIAALAFVGAFTFLLIGTIDDDVKAYQAFFLGGGFFLFLVVLPLMVFLALGREKRYRRAVLQAALASLRGAYYEQAKDLADDDAEALKDKGATPFARHLALEDGLAFQGVYQGIPFQAFPYSYSAKGPGHPVAVVGFALQSAAYPAAPTPFVVNRAAPAVFFKEDKLLSVKEESILYEAKHRVSAGDILLGTSLLSPAFVTASLDLEKALGGVISYQREGTHLWVYADGLSLDFVPTLSKKNTPESWKAFLSVLKLAGALLSLPH